jgi:hypothetical protein
MWHFLLLTEKGKKEYMVGSFKEVFHIPRNPVVLKYRLEIIRLFTGD